MVLNHSLDLTGILRQVLRPDRLEDMFIPASYSLAKSETAP